MLTLRTLAIVITGAGVFAGLPLTGAQACDDDRYPCPIRVQAQETADAPAQAAPSAQPQKKASHPARPSEKAQAKREREAPRAAAATVPAESSWLTYLLLILGAALAAASAFWFFFRTTSPFARRAANPRLHMSNS